MRDDYKKILDRLAGCKRVLVTTHVRPDGDALGSVTGMVLGLKQKGIAAEVLLLSHLPMKYSFVFRENGVEYHDAEKGWPAGLDLDSFDCLLVVDTGTWSQLPGLKEKLEGWGKPKLVVDHHLTQEGWADEKLVVKEAAAAGEIVAELLEQWGVKIDSAIATALYLAIVSDTGWFMFSNTRPFTMRLAATLMEAGVDTDRLYQLLYQNERPERILLQTRAMQSLELLAGGKLAVMKVSREDFEKTKGGVGDTEGMINVPLQIREVQVSVLVSEPVGPGPVRVSLRSKGQVDVAKFAEQFGGGGHARAAGLKFEVSYPEACEKVVTAMVERLSQGV
jgi:phosphoesterase RecJ-like protein